jgi:hypothetical protein
MSIFGNSNQGFGGGSSSGGGGGTVITDGVTIVGDGSAGNPLSATSAQPVYQVDLGLGGFDLIGQGIYNVNPDTTNAFVFNTTGIIEGEKVVIINTQAAFNLNVILSNGGTTSILYQGTFQGVNIVPSGMIYEFIYSISLGAWICLAPTPEPVNEGISLAFALTLSNNAFYKFNTLNPTDANTINFPDSFYFQGLRIIIWNADGTTSIAIDDNKPVEPDGTPISTLAANSISEFVAFSRNWVMIAQRAA